MHLKVRCTVSDCTAVHHIIADEVTEYGVQFLDIDLADNVPVCTHIETLLDGNDLAFREACLAEYRSRLEDEYLEAKEAGNDNW